MEQKKGKSNKKIDTSFSLYNYTDKEIKNVNEFIRESKLSNCDKFENIDLLKVHLTNFLNPYSYNPLGIITYNCNPDILETVKNLLPLAKANTRNKEDIDRAKEAMNAITKLLCYQFDSLRKQYNSINPSPIRILCYESHINLNMKQCGGNLTVINQMIYEIQEQFFKDQFTIWKLQAPMNNTDPAYTLRVIVSNASVHGTGYISYSFTGDGFTDIAGKIYGRIVGTLSHYTYKDKKSKKEKIIVNPLYTIENDIPYESKPKCRSQLDWYRDIYGEDFLKNNNPTRLFNTKPYSYERLEYNKNKKKKDEDTQQD